MDVNIDHVKKRFGDLVEKGHKVADNVWEFWVESCPVNPIKVKVERTSPGGDPRGSYTGVANYGIQNPSQFGPYRSIYPRPTAQDAVEEALGGFLMYYDPKQARQIKYELMDF